MSKEVTIAVDAMGGDNAPDVVLEGLSKALEADPDLKVILCGLARVVEPFVVDHDRCTGRVATQVITMDEHPAQAVRKKKDSSIVVGANLVKQGEAQGFFSAGSTGACLAAGTLIIGRIKGVARPTLATIIPSPKKPVVLCDVGANADCKPEYLVQFATMAAIYAERIVGVHDPRIGLLNIGEEDEKGSKFAQTAHGLLAKEVDGFAGNAEGRDIMDGKFDVIVTDGFTGNVCLKTIEGTAKALLRSFKEVLTFSLKSKLAALAIKDDLAELKESLNPDKQGGAPLLGLKGACFIGHGSSNAEAIKNGILATADYVRKDISEYIAQTVK